MKVAIHQPNFAPWLGFLAKMAQVDAFILLDDVAFTKGGFTNRVKIAGLSDAEWLTVPIRHHFGQMIRDVEIDGVEWEPDAFRRLHKAYRAEPGWNAHAELFAWMFDGLHTKLAGLNHDLIGSLCSVYRIECPVYLASDLRAHVRPGTGGLIDLVSAVGGTHYIAGGGSMAYDDPEEWELSGFERSVSRFVPPSDNGGLSSVHFGMTMRDPADFLRSCIRDVTERDFAELVK